VSGILPGAPGVTARAVDGGWLLTGAAPWVTGWGLVDVIHTAAHGPDGDILWTLVDAVASPTLTYHRQRLVAVNASATVSVSFADHFVPADRVTRTEPVANWVAGDPTRQPLVTEPGRPLPGRHYMATQTAALALGVAGRCCKLLGPGRLDDELLACREAVNLAATTDPAALPEARARASHLAVRAAAALVVATGSRSLLLDQHPQRLAREATFLLVFGSRPPVPAELLKLFTTAP
jgi:alkylation response protein AidB-like acyl-CoA dehydrogenase